MGNRPLIITGANGRIGQMLQKIWRDSPPEGLEPFFTARRAGPDLTWDIQSDPAPVWPKGAVILHLAGVVGRDPGALAANEAMIAPLVRAFAANDAKALLFASTAAVYAPGPAALDETASPAPPNAYGASKLAAERALQAAGLPLTILRIGNVAGAESLLSPRADHRVTLDPVPGREGGPLRSWIGPLSLARSFAALALRAPDLPDVVNLVQSPALPMADLLQAAGRDWHYGPENPAVVPSVVLADKRLRALCPLAAATPQGLISELKQVQA